MNISNKRPVALNEKSSHNPVRKVQEPNWEKQVSNINRKDFLKLVLKHMNYCSASLIIFKYNEQNNDEVTVSSTKLAMIREGERGKLCWVALKENALHKINYENMYFSYIVG